MHKKPVCTVVLPSNKPESRVVEVITELTFGLNSLDLEFLVNLDGPASVYEDKLRSLPVSRIKIYKETGTLSEILNKLILASSSDLIARADDDDFYLPGRLKLQIDFLNFRRDIDVLGTAILIKAGGAIRAAKYYPECTSELNCSFLFNCHGIAHPVVMMRKNSVAQLDYRNVPAEDMDLWVRLIANRVRFSNINVPSVIYSMPNYNEKRKFEMANSVCKSVEYLIGRHFKYENPESATLARILCDASTPATLDHSQINLVEDFMKKCGFDTGYGKEFFREVVRKYNRRLFAELLTRDVF